MVQPLDLTALRILCDAVGDGVVLFDRNDRAALINEAAHRLLGLRPGALDGLSTHHVTLSCLHVPGELMPRLRAGEVVGCPGPDGTPETFFVQLVTLPSGDPGECITGLVVRDRSVAHQLRRTEDALFGVTTRGSEPRRSGGGTPSRMLDHCGVLRALGREVRRSRRDGEQLSVMVVHAREGLERDELASAIEKTLRNGDRAGIIDGHIADGGDPSAQTLVNLVESPELALPRPGEAMAVLVLAGTGSAGLSAVSLRLRTELAARGATVSCGGATLRIGVGDLASDDAQTLLDRARRACQRESVDARSVTSTTTDVDLETTQVRRREDLAA